jgi:hypothetical protein
VTARQRVARRMIFLSGLAAAAVGMWLLADGDLRVEWPEVAGAFLLMVSGGWLALADEVGRPR